MNPITDRIQIGTIGELLVQLRLLEHVVQAAPPIKDSGNDLIAVRGEVFRAIQVKTTTRDEYSKANLPNLFHILAVVQLAADENHIRLDDSRVFLIPRSEVKAVSPKIEKIGRFVLCSDLVNALFAA